MFDSFPAGARPVFRIDPWMTDYSAPLPQEDDEQPAEARGFSIGYDIESWPWSEPVPAVDEPKPDSFYFVDGVQRTEAWGVLEAGDAARDAAIASIAVGGVLVEGGAAKIDGWCIERVLATSTADESAALRVALGGREVEFKPLYPAGSAVSPRAAIHDSIGRRRKELERECADRAMQDGRLVVVDGRLLFPSSSSAIVGLIKTIEQRYLDAEHWPLVARLQARQRTPVFRIDYDRGGSKYSWFLKLPYTRPINHSLAGIVRLETPEVGDREAIRLADLTARHLPAFASRPEHDPRAPQNLLPVGGLERRLRHEMGDSLFIRRAIEDHLMREAMAI